MELLAVKGRSLLNILMIMSISREALLDEKVL